MLETQLHLEYVENLPLTTVLSGEGIVVRLSLLLIWSVSLNLGGENAKCISNSFLTYLYTQTYVLFQVYESRTIWDQYIGIF